MDAAEPEAGAAFAGVGSRIAHARRAAGLSQRALAERLGIGMGMLDRLEHGLMDPGRFIDRIAEVTSRPVEWFASATAGGDAGMLSRQRQVARKEARLERMRQAAERRTAEIRAERLELARREDELRLRARQLDRREEELVARERRLGELEGEAQRYAQPALANVFALGGRRWGRRRG